MGAPKCPDGKVDGLRSTGCGRSAQGATHKYRTYAHSLLVFIASSRSTFRVLQQRERHVDIVSFVSIPSRSFSLLSRVRVALSLPPSRPLIHSLETVRSLLSEQRQEQLVLNINVSPVQDGHRRNGRGRAGRTSEPVTLGEPARGLIGALLFFVGRMGS